MATRLIVTLTYLLTVSAYDVVNAQVNLSPPAKKESPGYQFKNPIQNNMDYIARPPTIPQGILPNPLCQELTSAIQAVIVRGVGPDGKPWNGLQAYDMRKRLETEYHFGCQ
jgi:hypothetical protein